MKAALETAAPLPHGRTRSRLTLPESWHTRFTRWGFNLFPAYRGTGGRIAYIASDWSEIRIRLPLTWRTRNYVGTIFGGSIYGAIDPIYMIMLIKILGSGYVVWDKAATVRFLRPGRATLFATFRLAPDEIAAIRSEVAATGRSQRTFPVELVTASGELCATVEKAISIRGRDSAGRPDRTLPSSLE
jgi:acyl-coenzyme A thioesterase PaaI-like protein